MKKLLMASVAASSALIASSAFASSHREAPAIADDPAADNTDLWAWVDRTQTPAKVYIIASYNPMEEPSGGPNWHRFSDDVRYEIHVARGGTSLEDETTFHFRFKSARPTAVDLGTLDAAPPTPTTPQASGVEFFRQLTFTEQTMTVTMIQGTTSTVIAQDRAVAPPHYGAKTFAAFKALGVPPYNAPGVTDYDQAFIEAGFIHPLQGGVTGQVFAGPRDDGFYVDLGAVFDLANLRSYGAVPDLQSRGFPVFTGGTPQDNLANYNCHTIALEIDAATLNGGAEPTPGASAAQTLGIWASASRRKATILRANGRNLSFGPWVQVSRLGLPLINEAVIGIQDKDKYNRTRPATDAALFGAYFFNPVLVRDAEVAGVYDAVATLVDPDPNPNAYKHDRTDIIDTINLNNPDIDTIGDVLRLDLGVTSGFPNGRPIPGGAAANKEQADVTDVLLSLILTGGAVALTDGVNSNDVDFEPVFPYLAPPHNGFDQGHGRTPAP
ncbi:MAG: DUF4331 domain-containing protein [Myxococcota bacterium]